VNAAALRLTCCCGGEMVYAGSSFVAQKSEREAFNQRHAACKPLIPPPAAPAGRYRIAGRR
jgi:hypothetical protein